MALNNLNNQNAKNTPMDITGLMELFRPEIRSLAAYHVQSSAGMLKLDAMENPYPLPAPVQTAWAETLAAIEVNRYPAPDAPALKQAIRRAMAIPHDMEILLGNGSDEIIQILLMALAKPAACVLAVEPCFVMYKMIARFVGMNYIGVPLTPDFQIHRDETLAAIQTCQPAIIFLAEPNNPTGNHFDPETVEAIIQAAPGLVVIDEAYLPFSDRQALPLLEKYPQVVIMRTLSKQGLAGLRLGLLVGRPELLHECEKVRLPYNINVLTQAVATLCLTHQAEFDAQAKRICAERDRLQTELDQVGLHPFPSSANFILARTASGQARPLFEGLKRRGVLIKCLDGGHPLLTDCLRFTVSTPEENSQCLTAVKEVLEELNSQTHQSSLSELSE